MSDYRKTYKGAIIDPYRIYQLYGIGDGPTQHAIKKLLRAGRGDKSLRRDIEEAIDCLNRKLEMLDEDQAQPTGGAK